MMYSRMENGEVEGLRRQPASMRIPEWEKCRERSYTEKCGTGRRRRGDIIRSLYSSII